MPDIVDQELWQSCTNECKWCGNRTPKPWLYCPDCIYTMKAVSFALVCVFMYLILAKGF